jgi:hypothetical protein
MGRLITWAALVVIAAMIAVPFIPGITDRQINMVLGGVAVVSVVGMAAGKVVLAIQDRREDGEPR